MLRWLRARVVSQRAKIVARFCSVLLSFLGTVFNKGTLFSRSRSDECCILLRVTRMHGRSDMKIRRFVAASAFVAAAALASAASAQMQGQMGQSQMGQGQMAPQGGTGNDQMMQSHSKMSRSAMRMRHIKKSRKHRKMMRSM